VLLGGTSRGNGDGEGRGGIEGIINTLLQPPPPSTNVSPNSLYPTASLSIRKCCPPTPKETIFCVVPTLSCYGNLRHLTTVYCSSFLVSNTSFWLDFQVNLGKRLYLFFRIRSLVPASGGKFFVILINFFPNPYFLFGPCSSQPLLFLCPFTYFFLVKDLTTRVFPLLVSAPNSHRIVDSYSFTLELGALTKWLAS
jgi:hypothetical protein